MISNKLVEKTHTWVLLCLLTVSCLSQVFASQDIAAKTNPSKHILQNLKSLTEETGVSFLVEILKALSIKHVIAVLPEEGIGSEFLHGHLYSNDMTAESLVLHDFNSSYLHRRRTVYAAGRAGGYPTFDGINYRYLYGRAPIMRQEVVVVVQGPAQWATKVAIKLMSLHILGPRDHLVVFPTEGQVSWMLLSPKIPPGSRVAVVQDGQFQEARISLGSLNPKTTAIWTRGKQLKIKEALMPMVTRIPGVNITAIVGKGWDVMDVGFFNFKDKTPVGLFASLMTQICTHMQANLINVEAFPAIRFGSNGSFEGPLGFIERWEGDIAVSFFFIRKERADAVDFTSYVYLTKAPFLTHYPFKVEEPLILFKIFYWQVWLTIICALVILSIVLSVLWENSDEKYISSPGSLLYNSKAGTAFSSIFKTIVFQGVDHTPSSIAGRLLYGVFLLTVVVLGYSYSGSLTATLSVPRYEKVPDTLQEILDFGYRVWIQEGFAQYNFMKESESPVMQQLFKEAEISQIKTPVPTSSVMDRASRTNMALIVMSPPKTMNTKADFGGSGIAGRLGVCTVRKMVEPLHGAIVAFALNRNSPLGELINSRILALVAAGVMGDDEIKQQIIPDAGINCLPPPKPSPEPEAFHLVQLAAIFMIFAAGNIMAIIVFIAEAVLHKCAENNITSEITLYN